MEDTKPIYLSTTFWSSIVVVLSGVAGLFGYVITEADQQSIVHLLVSGATTIGGALAIYGRIVATKRIGK